MKLNIPMFIAMNNYTAPDPKDLLNQTGQYVTNGEDNEYYYYIQDRYKGSPTNAAIIDAYSKFIYGEGLEITNSGKKLTDYITKSDMRLICNDIKMYGAFAVQIVYTKDRKDIAKIYHISVPTVGIHKQKDLSQPIENYWYCFDWRNKTKFKPIKVPAYGTSNEGTELYVCKIPSPQPLFPLPDYDSGLQYCELEEELSNFYLSHIKNRFQTGTLINVNAGLPEDDKVKEEAERAILSKVQGTSNAGNIIISFNDNAEHATTVEHFSVPDAYEQYTAISSEAEKKIMMSHKVTNGILFGVKESSGFGNNADEMVVALKTLYRSQINPIREIVIDGLEHIFRTAGYDYELGFKDFEELQIKDGTTNNIIE